MPLLPGATRDVIAENIRREVTAGRPQRQAVAVALSEARRWGQVPRPVASRRRPVTEPRTYPGGTRYPTDLTHSLELQQAIRKQDFHEVERHARELAGLRGAPNEWPKLVEQAAQSVQSHPHVATRNQPHPHAAKRHSADLHPLIQVGVASAAALSVPRVDAMVQARPLGPRVTPSLAAIPVAVLGTFLLGAKGHRKLARGVAMVGLGFAGGNLVLAVRGKDRT